MEKTLLFSLLFCLSCNLSQEKNNSNSTNKFSIKPLQNCIKCDTNIVNTLNTINHFPSSDNLNKFLCSLDQSCIGSFSFLEKKEDFYYGKTWDMLFFLFDRNFDSYLSIFEKNEDINFAFLIKLFSEPAIYDLPHRNILQKLKKLKTKTKTQDKIQNAFIESVKKGNKYLLNKNRNIFPEKQLNFEIKKINTLLSKGKLKKYRYPSMSSCGGALYGYYLNDELKIIDATYSGELGFSKRKIYFQEEKILKIEYQEYFAEWNKYNQKYPSEQFEFDEKKMTYTDTLFEISFGKKLIFNKSSKRKIVSKEIDIQLMKRLILCVEKMKTELNNKKVLK